MRLQTQAPSGEEAEVGTKHKTHVLSGDGSESFDRRAAGENAHQWKSATPVETEGEYLNMCWVLQRGEVLTGLGYVEARIARC
jgi:hypothetical protein